MQAIGTAVTQGAVGKSRDCMAGAGFEDEILQKAALSLPVLMPPSSLSNKNGMYTKLA